MRIVLMVVLMVMVGCSSADPPTAPDAALDAQPVDAALVPNDPSGQVPVGAACDSATTFWCDNYLALCAHDVCRAQCDPVGYPHCPRGQHEIREDIGHGAGRTCVCVPD